MPGGGGKATAECAVHCSWIDAVAVCTVFQRGRASQEGRRPHRRVLKARPVWHNLRGKVLFASRTKRGSPTACLRNERCGLRVLRPVTGAIQRGQVGGYVIPNASKRGRSDEGLRARRGMPSFGQGLSAREQLGDPEQEASESTSSLNEMIAITQARLRGSRSVNRRVWDNWLTGLPWTWWTAMRRVIETLRAERPSSLR